MTAEPAGTRGIDQSAGWLVGFERRRATRKGAASEVNMVNPLEIMPVLALAAMIAFIPLLGDCPEPSKQTRRAPLKK